MTPRILIVIICSVLSSLGLPANAQEQSANDILDASRVALQELSGFGAQFRMKGKGAPMFANTLPSMSGQLFFGTSDEYGRVIHCIGEARETQTTPSQAIDILLTIDRYLWTDTNNRTITERPIAGSSRGLPSAFPLVLLRSIITDDPYAKDANNAQSIELLAQEIISGELCDVIHIKRAKPGTRAGRSASDTYTDARWFIGSTDNLPRKVEHITDAGLVKITLVFELSNLKITNPTDTQLDVSRPAGFVFKSTMPKPKPVQDPDQLTIPVQTPSTNPINPQSNQPRTMQAPPYAFIPVGSSEVNNATQSGKITVLYCWGSWCVPCKTTSPLVSELAQSFESNPVEIFGLAIREADPDQTRTDFDSKNYHHALVLDADPLVSSFKIRVYPTLVVINRSGEIVFQQSINKERTSEELVAQAKEAIQSAIDN